MVLTHSKQGELNLWHIFVLPLLSAALMAMASLHIPWPARPGGDFCFLMGNANHRLTWVALEDFDPRTNETTIGRSRTTKTDAIALQPHTGLLFGVNVHMPRYVGYLGTFNLATGAFVPRSADLGNGQGPLGTIHFYDVSGLAFDPATGWLYATQIEVGPGVPDVLFRIDPQTGRYVAGAFAGADYVLLEPLAAYPHLSDVDDISFDPASGGLYGIVNNSEAGDRLVRIDKTTGKLTDVGAFGVGEVEGLSFDPNGRLWATAGGDRYRPNQVYQVDPQTGQATNPRPIDNSFNYEALACSLAQPASD